MSCPRCAGNEFYRVALDSGGEAHICEDCAWPRALRMGRRFAMTAFMMARLPRGGTVLAASHAGAAHLQRYANLFGRQDLDIRAMPRREEYQGVDYTTFTIDEADTILGDLPEYLK